MSLRALIFVCGIWAGTAHAAGPSEAVSDLIEGMVTPEFKEYVTSARAENPKRDYESLAMLAVLDETLPVAIWAYKRDLNEDKLDTFSMSNLAVLLADLGAAAEQPALISAAETLLIEAITILPSEWTSYHNLGALYLERSRSGGGEPDLLLARRMLEEAVRLAPRSPGALMKYAEVLEAAGDPLATRYFRQAYLLDSTHIAVLQGYSRIPSFRRKIAPDEERQCNVDFRCESVCPITGIAPGLKHEVCVILESDAIGKCMKGLPYENRYDCKTKKPAFGILIPGIDPGLSIVTPWGNATIIVDGAGVSFDISFGFKIPGAKHGLKAGLSVGWDGRKGGKIDLSASRNLGGGLTGVSGELKVGARSDRKTGEITYQAGSKFSGKVGVPVKGADDVYGLARYPARGGFSAGFSTTGERTLNFNLRNAKTKFKVNPQ